jgi:hypothetical protein
MNKMSGEVDFYLARMVKKSDVQQMDLIDPKTQDMVIQ